MKTVFPNRQLEHVWAQQTQSHGKTGNGNISFDGTVLYSYSTPIANIVEAVGGSKVALITNRRYSVTTTSHVSGACGAASQYQQFTVPNLALGAPGFTGRHHEYDNPHGVNLVYLAEQYTQAVAQYRSARLSVRWEAWDAAKFLTDSLQSTATLAQNYAALFALAHTAPDVASDVAAIIAYRAKRHAKHHTPEAVARRAADAERRRAKAAEAERIARMETAEKIAGWRDGLNVYLPWGAQRDGNGGALLRIRGDNLETSMGATVPLSHAIAAFQRIVACRSAGTSWHRNGSTIRVGHFQIDEINPDGSFRAGCHLINWPEVESAARAAGVLTTETETVNA
jgi:hypothetical protein